ncbi:MAG: caspase family protein, partial [Phycisphaeraceae bacterium]|nr:caspase family protein [Phycisphaeraceae bacterium]
MKKHALLVGVEDYRDRMISRLSFARADATALAQRLSDRCGFDRVRILADQGGDDEPLLVNIVTALRDISSELRKDDLFLFFFAGHGVEKDGHGYLLARDSLHAFPEHGSLSLQLLRKTFEHLSASKRILLLDACRNSPDAGRADAANRMGDVISRDIVAAARSNLGGGTTTALLSACRSGQRAYEWPGRGHGVFTQYLLEGLDGAAWTGDELEFDRLAGYAARQVRQWSAGTPGLPIPQEPWYEKFGDPDSILLAVGQQAASATRTRPAAPPGGAGPSPPGPVARWWVILAGAERGPLDDAAVREGIRAGDITRQSECWRAGMDQWQAIATMPEWADAFP